MFYSVAQTADNARQFLTYLDSELGVPRTEKNYAQDCQIYTPKHPDGPFANIADKMDIFAISHLYGWYLKVDIRILQYNLILLF